MSATSGKGVSLPLGRSRYLIGYSVLLHSLAGFAVLYTAMSLPAVLLLLVFLSISLLRHSYLLGFVGNNGRRVTMVLHKGKNSWQLQFAEGTRSDLLELKAVWSTRLAVIVSFHHPAKRPLRLLIMNDAVDSSRFRQLRAQLRLAFFRQ